MPTPSFLSPNPKTSKFKNTNNLTPASISKHSNQNDEDTNIHGVTVADEIRKIEYLQRKIVMQNLKMKRMQRKSNKLEDTSISSLVQSEEASLTVEHCKNIYVEQTEFLLQISKLEAKMEI